MEIWWVHLLDQDVRLLGVFCVNLVKRSWLWISQSSSLNSYHAKGRPHVWAGCISIVWVVWTPGSQEYVPWWRLTDPRSSLHLHPAAGTSASGLWTHIQSKFEQLDCNLEVDWSDSLDQVQRQKQMHLKMTTLLWSDIRWSFVDSTNFEDTPPQTPKQIEATEPPELV